MPIAGTRTRRNSCCVASWPGETGSALTLPPRNTNKTTRETVARPDLRRPDNGCRNPLSSKAFAVQRYVSPSDDSGRPDVESLMPDFEVRGAVAGFDVGHTLGVSSLAGEVVTAARHRNVPIGAFSSLRSTCALMSTH